MIRLLADKIGNPVNFSQLSSQTGLRNYALNLAGRLEPPVNMGMIFENFVFNILFEKALANNWNIKYWRSKDKAEIDFIIDKGYEQIPVEVKFQDLKRTSISRSFHSFLKKYQPARALIVNLSLETSIYAGVTKVSFIPFYRLFAE
ncbi:MAG TPA: DUF4143 domain-containing protein [Phaeodactylibacter sp.]|nr:DUF4143 domain-containing protein [Phaeodactylibacter sp.]